MGAPNKTNCDDALFVYQNDEKSTIVYGLTDARSNKKWLADSGYQHIATVSGAVMVERLYNLVER